MDAMAKGYRPWAPTQSFLLPPSPLEWLEEGHLAYFVLDVVTGSLDLTAIERVIQAKDWRGERPYAPTMMVALLVYAYSVGVFSSRRMARATYEDVAFRVLAGGEHPHFTTINQFRLEHRAALADLFVQVLRLCRKAGLVKLGHVSFDGSKVLANASKHKAMSYQRMQEEEKRLAAEVEALLKRGEETDRQEDERYGEGNTAEDLPAELRRREDRLTRIREAKAALEREAAQARAEALRQLAEGMREKSRDESVPPKKRREAATRASHCEEQARELDDDDDDDDGDPSGTAVTDDLPRHRVPVEPDGTPKPKAQRNFTDPDSRIMMKDGAVVQAYNAQIAVDAQAQVIVAVAVTNQPPDQEHLVPMLDRVIDNCGSAPAVVTADNGFLSKGAIEACVHRGVDGYISVGRASDKAPRAGQGAPTLAQQARAAMAAKLRTDAGKAAYARRKVIVEPPFGQIKQARGFRRFSFRGLRNVRHEWNFVALTHNLLKLFRGGGLAAIQATP
jgi:transposase